MENAGPLKGLKVVEIANVIAGPFCAALMADYGADVIKVEMPGKGDPFRQFMPKAKDGKSVRWPTMGRNKKCVTLNLKAPEGREVFLRLIEDADVVVENFRPGTIEKWNIGYDVMKAVNKKLVLVRISGYGQTGPYHEKTGFGMPAGAFSGYTTLQGYPDLPPVCPPVSLADFMAGIYGFIGAVSAVLAIKNGTTDEGQVIDVSLYEPLVRMLDDVISDYSLNGVIRERVAITLGSSPTTVVQCKDNKYVILAASTPNTWERIPMVMGKPELLTDPRFVTNFDRVKHNDELIAIIHEWAEKMTMNELVRVLDEAGVPAAPCNEVDDMFVNPQFVARESIVDVPHPVYGSVGMTNIFPRFSGTPCEIRHCGHELGADNDAVYRVKLGISEEKLRSLQASGVI